MTTLPQVRRPSCAAVETLPNELLASIFATGAASEVMITLRYSVTPFPCLVSSVNRHWREVAINLPIIWTSVIMSDNGSLEFPALCIRRSGDLPLHAFAFLGRNDSRTQEIAELLILHLHRLSRLSINMSMAHLPRDFFSCFTHLLAPELQHLDVQLEDEWPISLQDALTDISLDQFLSGGTPRLFSLWLRGDILVTSPRWATVTSLSLTLDPLYRNRIWDDLTDLLGCCPLLEELVVNGSIPLPYDHELDNDIHLDSLRALAVDCLPSIHHPADVALFLTHIKAPALRYLELSCVSGLALNRLLARHSAFPIYPTLETLRIFHFIPGNEGPASVHELFPSIRELQTDTTSCEALLFPSLLPPLPSPDDKQLVSLSIWPHLDTLTFEKADFNRLYDIVQSRKHSGHSLSHIRIRDACYSALQLELLKEYVSVERLIDHVNGYIPSSPAFDIKDFPDLSWMWSESET
ncbi:hypothetical protein BV22DRAFT_263496 [Leucogyrophana mollusca]|uniref:Uncharacterized protein n=1 Tax=Leucogyrophana mollusca TaxID=85980 RepID=A0ACB8BRJ3_9AGAM|nr:hypothetical protein BV22DRAFT_263496 [Leucogyrophana mollusca]